MAIDLTMLADDLEFMQNDLPATIVYAGVSYTVAAGDPGNDMSLELDGIQSPYDVMFVCKVSDFPSVPKVGEAVLYDSKRLTIVGVDKDAAAVGFTLRCQNEYK